MKYLLTITKWNYKKMHKTVFLWQESNNRVANLHDYDKNVNS